MTPAAAPSAKALLLLAFGYFATGKVALLLALPPGYATAIWPPAGIALAALLILGSRAWPGILIGSFLVNMSASFDGANAVRSIIFTSALGAGAAIQALVGASLIRRFVGTPVELRGRREIALFLFLGGPVSGVAAASVGVASLYFNGLIQPAQIPFSWWTWWVGDVIGVAVMAPLVLIAFGEPRDFWRRRAVPVALPLGLLMVLVTALFVMVSAREAARITTQFRMRATVLGAALKGRMEGPVEVLRSLESSQAAASGVDPKMLRKFVELPDRSIQALSWNPRVLDADRAAFEKGGIAITDRDYKGHLIAAPRRSEYFPVHYIEPQESNSAALGFDVSSGIVRFEALRRACDSGLPAATRKVQLVQEDSSSGLLVYLPIYSGTGKIETPDDRRRRLAGYFAAALRLEEFLRPVGVQAAGGGLEVALHDAESDPGVGALWQSSRSVGAAPPEFHHVHPFEFAGRRWSAVFGATPAYVANVRSWKPWGILAAGMLATAILGAILLAATGNRP